MYSLKPVLITMTTNEIDACLAEYIGWEFVASHDNQNGVAVPDTWYCPQDGRLCCPGPPEIANIIDLVMDQFFQEDAVIQMDYFVHLHEITPDTENATTEQKAEAVCKALGL